MTLPQCGELSPFVKRGKIKPGELRVFAETQGSGTGILPENLDPDQGQDGPATMSAS